MNSSKKAYLLGGLAVFFWSTVATAFKLGLRELDFMQLIFYSSLVSLVALFVILTVTGRIHLLFRQTRRELLNSVFLGTLNPVMYYLVLFKAYSLLPAQLAQPLNMVWPIVMALLAVPLLNQKLGWLSLVAMLISFTGVLFISSQGGIDGFGKTNWLGAGLALGSSVAWALYWILNVRDKRDPVVKLFQNFFFGVITLFAVVLIFSDFTIQWGVGARAMIYIGLFETGITYVLWLKAMEYSRASAKIGNLVFLAPFLSLIFIHFILKESIMVTTFIGLVFIIAGILLQQRDKHGR